MRTEGETDSFLVIVEILPKTITYRDSLLSNKSPLRIIKDARKFL